MDVLRKPAWGSKLISGSQQLPGEIDDGGVGIAFALVLVAMLIGFLLGVIEILIRVCFAFVRALFEDRNTHRSSAKSRIQKAPGANLLAVAEFFFSHQTVEQTFRPLVADWRYEYCEALKESRKWKGRWISVRYRYSFIMAMGLSKVFSLLKQLRLVSK